MKQKSRERVQRAIGLIKGVEWVLEDKGVKEVLNGAANLLVRALEEEDGADNEQRKAD